MKYHIAIQVPTDTFLELAAYLQEKGDTRDPSEIAALAIESWLAEVRGKGDCPPRKTLHGYQWKNLFLPDTSELRMQYKDQFVYVRVIGDAIMYDGHAVSPRQLANAIAGGTRNAWRDLWIRRPSDKRWTLADACRRELKIMAERAPPGVNGAKLIAAPAMPESLRNALDTIDRAEAKRKAGFGRRTDIVLDS